MISGDLVMTNHNSHLQVQLKILCHYTFQIFKLFLSIDMVYKYHTVRGEILHNTFPEVLITSLSSRTFFLEGNIHQILLARYNKLGWKYLRVTERTVATVADYHSH